MSTYRDVLLARLRRENRGWALFRAAPLAQLRAKIIECRWRLCPSDERPEELGRLHRALPDCLLSTARDGAAVLDQRPDLAKEVGIDGPGLRDLIDRRSDCDKIAAVSAQVARAAELASQDGAVSLADLNQRVLTTMVEVYNDAATPAAERSVIGTAVAELNSMAELQAHRAGQAALSSARRSTTAQQEIDDQQQPEAVRRALRSLQAVAAAAPAVTH